MKIGPKILSQAAGFYGIELSQLRPLGGMEGMALEYNRGNESFVLKVTPTEKDNPSIKEQIQAKCDFIIYLSENGIKVAEPVTSPGGNWVEKVATEEKDYLVTASTKAAGKHINLYDPTQASLVFFQSWGRVTGQMHTAAQSYKHWQKQSEEDPTVSPIIGWKEEHEFFKNWCQFDEVRERWVQIGKFIEDLPVTRGGYGLIHNDLHPWNFLVDSNGEITVIDFDVCAFHFFIKDIAIALFFANWQGYSGRSGEKDNYLTNFFHNFMMGYSKENELNAIWFHHLPTFIKHHQILLFTVFTDEWKSPNGWQIKTLNRWKRQIVDNKPVVNIKF